MCRKKSGECGFVYHSSSRSGLKEIKTDISTHGESWVYATRDMIMSAVFLGTLGGDLTCQIGRDQVSGLPYICERYEGALEDRYGNVKGSIYILPAADFEIGKTAWEEEIICRHAVPVHDEIRVRNALRLLKKLDEKGKLIIKYYPERIDNIPEDDSDLVAKCITWTLHNPGFMELVEKFQPGLAERVREGVVNSKP